MKQTRKEKLQRKSAMVASPNTMAPLLLRNPISSLFLFVDESLINLSERYKVLDIVRCLVVSSFLFFLRLLLSVVSSLKPMKFSEKFPPEREHKKSDYRLQPMGGVGDSGIARALSQLLTIVNTVPVSSRKYDVVRSLAERLIDENLQQGFEALHEVNRTVLSAAFSKTLVQLEAAMMEQERARGGGCGFSSGSAGSGAKPAEYYNLNRVLRMVKSFSDMAWSRAAKPREESGPEGGSAEKLAAELVWLAQKLTFCGFAKEAVCRWASASNLAWLAVSAEPRLQGLLVNISGNAPPFALFLPLILFLVPVMSDKNSCL